MEPKAGALTLLGSMAAAYGAAWACWTLFPFPADAFAKLPSPPTNEGAWLILSAWVVFPLVFGAALLRAARGVEPTRLAWAYAGVTYFMQCAAELTGRDEVTLWPELLLTALPTMMVFFVARKYSSGGSGSSDSAS